MVGQVTREPEPATLDLDSITHGVEKSQEVSAPEELDDPLHPFAQRIDPPPGTLFMYGDNQVVNARKAGGPS